MRIPKPKKQDCSIAKDGVLAVRFSITPVTTAGLGVRSPEPSRVGASPFLPRKIGQQGQLDSRVTRDLLDQKRFQEKPYLIAEIAFSKLDARAEDKAEVPFRIRWS